ncbi:MAG TPA: glycosyltransferase family 1 protein [Burkholderiales bacterium]|nr:glycosyltransferase family 1 protein [Burkholderiales bacterium]
MNLAVDVRKLGDSGIGTYVANVLARLVPAFRGGEVRLLGERGAIEQLPWARGERVSVIQCSTPTFSVEEQLRLPALIPRDTGLLWSPQFNIPLFYRGKLLVTIHDVIHLAQPRFMEGWHRRAYARALLAAVRAKADRVIADSRFTADELVRLVGVDRARIEVIHLGVDDAWYSVPRSPRPHGKPYFVFVGNVKAHKNIRGLIAAFGALAERLPHDLVIVGKKEGFVTGDRQVERMSAALGERVKFTGLVDDELLRRYVACAEALVLPSFYEGFGLPPLEAMACGCPVIVSNRASLPEVCGEAALYCEPEETDDIAAKMLRVAQDADTRAGLRERGLRHARTFTWEKCARETLAVIESLG